MATRMRGVRTSVGYEIAALIEIATHEGVARRESVKAERNRAGSIIWFINGNKCSKRDAERRVDDDISCDRGPVLSPF